MKNYKVWSKIVIFLVFGLLTLNLFFFIHQQIEFKDPFEEDFRRPLPEQLGELDIRLDPLLIEEFSSESLN